MTKKILITDYVWPSTEPEEVILKEAGFETVIAPDSSEETLATLAKDVEGIMFCFAQVTGNVLNSAQNCKIAARFGIGVDNVDINKATELGIVVTNVPDYCMDEVTDHAMGMILSLNRRFVPHTNQVLIGEWDKVSLNEPIHRTRGATLGIVGFGRIGRSLAAKASGFGMKIIAYDPLLNTGDSVGGVEIVEFEDLLRQSDFISLHVPLIKQTQGMIGANELKIMKKGSIIINCARGGLIDEEALSEALSSGHIGGAGLDVLEPTPPKRSNPLFQNRNVIITPHTAFFSEASTLELETRTAQEVVRVISGNEPENWINPEVRGKSRVGI
jgi:D-3-phosphoglycerate dehydrogenase